jgi:hypothetical protein
LLVSKREVLDNGDAALELHFGRGVMPERLHCLRRSCGCAQQIGVWLALRKVLGCRKAQRDGFNTARRCTCSYCRMRGAVAVSADVGGITFDAGEAALTVYRFNTGVAQHYFCSRCGIYTHHHRRSNPNQYGVNVACLKGVSPFDFADVPVIDGVNHPTDHGRGYEIVGHLRFIRT